jgi:transcriptional regulator of acetoin/glycerol metabolism
VKVVEVVKVVERVVEKVIPCQKCGADPQLTTIRDAEVKLIMETLGHFNGKVYLAAKSLGIPRRTLYRRLTELGVVPKWHHPS